MAVAKLSITQAWSETGGFLGREGRLILPIALLLLVIPAIVLTLLTPPPSADPGGLQLAFLFVLNLLNLALGLIAVIAITHLAMRRGASVGEALQAGARRFLPLLAATLLIVLAIMIVLVPLLVVAVPDLASGARPPSQLPASAAPILLIAMLSMLLLWIRLMLMTPVATAEPGGPIAIIRRSWTLTSAHYWKLLGVSLLLGLVLFTAVVAFTSVFGVLVVLLAGPVVPGSTSATIIAVISSLLQAVVTVVFAVWIARVYTQLRGENTSDVFA